ncbi:MAG: argininosuccinate lyase [Hyphomonas sp.]|uniref:argininosuccinate lyase n=1 Tax=Hyphomonas sp. TaxID=87 RepID=UPI001841DD3B|nr:argininosuccinate lyase [Hyphomonas sp.]MBA3068986.1 argininosuccinate lyase [Hyphomonas sp.]MBU3920630.1 argininosuccinate lyase [Alphaproteobacteria bacterium]MBU4061619.1 argininosuccinate lyase [Alphaproteobacteria bacterium]MBU4163464.1 argininosuccinate lyase [Alphaproteobacteria bacterium]
MNSGKGQTMWGGRFAATPSAIMNEINASLDIDRRMAEEDVAGSRAHADMLAEMGILTAADNEAIQGGLDRVSAELRDGTFPFRRELEDIHMNVEARLKELIGEPAGRLHTARSRNDQVVTDFRLWTRRALDDTSHLVTALQAVLVRRAGEHAATFMPGFTHLQTAQPVTLGHHLLAYVEMLERDRTRLLDCAVRLNECPLGAAALAGTGFPIDRDMTAEALGFARPMANSLDAVGSRDFALEALSALSIAATHLSRLAEEIVLWTSPQFAFAALPDEWSTGSSIMPQKRNPDAAELVRAKASLITGLFVALQGAVKALPLAYAKDLQDDKRLTFEAFDTYDLCARAMAGMVETIRFKPDAMRAAAGKGFSTATDLADWLVRELGLPFRDAHHVTGRIVAMAEGKGAELADLSLGEMQKVHSAISKDVFNVLTVEASASSRTSYGGTSPVRVQEQVAQWTQRLRLE